MMRAIVFSDAHGSLQGLDQAILHYHHPEYVFGLGDYEVDPMELNIRNVTGVKGNSFMDPVDYPYDFVYETCGFRILFTHGHTHGVRGGLYSLIAYCLKNRIDICFFGHTHEAILEEHSGICFVNPGSLGIPDSPSYPTLVYLTINEGTADIAIVDTEDFISYREKEFKKIVRN